MSDESEDKRRPLPSLQRLPHPVGVMSADEVHRQIQRAVRSRQTSYLYEDFTDWMPVIGVDSVRATLKCPGAQSGNFSAVLAIQYAATRPEVPGAWTAYGTAITGGNEGVFAPNIAADAASQMWFRMGIGSKYTTAPDEAQVTFQAAWNACGRIVDTRTVSVFTGPLAQVGTIVLTEWLPRNDVDRAKAAIEVMKYDRVGGGTFKYCLAYQTAVTAVESTTDTWTAVGTTYTDANSAVNTGEVSITTTDKMFIRFGLQYWQETAGSTRADFNTTVATRRAGLMSWGALPTSWGTLEGGLQRSVVNDTIVYSGANSPTGDVYDHPSAPYSLTAYAETAGDPSGPSAWGSSGTVPWWVGYNAATGKWGVYKIVTGAAALVAGTELVGPPNGLARISVNGAKTICTFDVSFDQGASWQILAYPTDTWDWRTYTIQDSTTYTVKREVRA